jgi:hypothetical protein
MIASVFNLSPNRNTDEDLGLYKRGEKTADHYNDNLPHDLSL